jgi:hypothetical protein
MELIELLIDLIMELIALWDLWTSPTSYCFIGKRHKPSR